MKPIPPFATGGWTFRRLISSAFCACLVAGAALAQQPVSSGSIHGQVSNATTHANLDGAHIRVAETDREVLTGSDGSYVVAGLAPGSYTLVVDYAGLDVQRVTVQVPAGGDVQQDIAMNSNTYVLEKFTVAGEREGNAAAIVAQRNAINVQNVITADAFGSIAKGNVGNFLRRLPGIAGTTDEMDTENIMLRGMGAEFTTLDIDGARYASPGTSRGQSALSVPTDMIERVEVIKSPLPENDADSLGGRVNLVTKNAFDRQGRQIVLRAGDSYSFTYGRAVGRHADSSLAPSLAASYSDVFSVAGGHNNLGVYTSANYERTLDVRGTTSWGDNMTTVNGVQYPRFNNGSIALFKYPRFGATTRVDYKISRQASIGTQLSFNGFENNMFRTRNQIKNGTAQAALSKPDFTYTVLDGNSYGTERSDRHAPTNRIAARVYGKVETDGGYKFDAELSAQRSTMRNYTTFYNATSAQKFNYVLDRTTGDYRWPAIRMLTPYYTGSTRTTTAIPATFVELNPFSDDFSNTASASGLQFQRIFSKNEIVTAKANAAKVLPVSFPLEIKTGVSYRGQSVKNSRSDLRGDLNVSPSGYGPNLSALNDNSWDLGGAIGRYPVGTTADLNKVLDALGISYAGPNDDPVKEWNFNPKNFTVNQSSTWQNTLQNRTKIFEQVYGTYLEATTKLGRLSLVGGVRMERTENTRNSPVRNRRLAGSLAEWTDTEWRSGSYSKYLPSIHGRYTLTRNLIVRASYGQTFGRPNWSNIMGVEDVNDSSHTISVPNLNLKPRTSKNYDLGLDYYFEPVGLISVGVFRKDIRNYEVTTSDVITTAEAIDLGATPAPGDTTPYTVSTKTNAGYGRVDGVELNYSQSLNFLPGVLRGFGVFANFTYLKTQGTFNLGSASAPVAATRRLQGFIPRTANAGLSYVYDRLDLRASWNFTDWWPENTPTDPNTTKIRGSRYSIDASSKFRLTRHVSLFADFVNITSTHGEKYWGWVAQNRRVETNALGFLMTAGVQATF